MPRGFTDEEDEPRRGSWRHSEDDEPDVTISGVNCVHHTKDAILVQIGAAQHWVPQSVVCDESEVYATGHKGKLIVRAWFARKAGLRARTQ
jgi:hypothetical protein